MNDFSGVESLLVAGIGAVSLLVAVVLAPMVGRGPGLRPQRDPSRVFPFETRIQAVSRAANRCENPRFLAWGRCRQIAVEADHVYPWAKGGATVMSNAQALCRDHHNRLKPNRTPRWWYVLCLELRRRQYFPESSDVRVYALAPSRHKGRRQSSGSRARTSSQVA